MYRQAYIEFVYQLYKAEASSIDYSATDTAPSNTNNPTHHVSNGPLRFGLFFMDRVDS